MNGFINKIALVVFFALIYSSVSAQSYLRYKVVEGDTIAVCDLSVVTVGWKRLL